MHEWAVELANTMIPENGRDLVFKTTGATTGPNYDPTPGVDTEVTTKGVDIMWKDSIRSKNPDAKQTAKVFLVSTLDNVLPQVDERVLDTGDNIEYHIKAVEPLMPGETNIMWEVYCDR